VLEQIAKVQTARATQQLNERKQTFAEKHPPQKAKNG
jgi:hypothetical protein